jgi:nucleoside-diphosphate-sugar epimerase
MTIMILVIGATSFIGPAVVEKLLGNNYNVKCLVRTDSNIEKLTRITDDNNKLKNKKIEFVTGNLQSSDSIFNSLKEIDSAVYLVDIINTNFIKNFLTAISKTKIKRAVFLSSTTVLVPLKNKAKDLKLESEDIIKKSNLDYTILRPTMIYGSRQDRNYSKMINFIKKRGFFIIFGSGNNLIQPIYIGDVAEAVSLVIKNPKTFKKSYEICGKEPIKYKDMLEIAKDKLKKPFKIVKLPLKLSKVCVNIYNKIFPQSELKPDMIERMEIDKAYSYEEASKDFGFSPISFKQGIDKLIKELKA